MLKKTENHNLRLELSQAEFKLIKYLRELGWGTVEVNVQDRKPVLIKAAIKSVKLA